ncbi:TPA: type II toxin-antitoxin system VapC family toxin [Candidatus Woesearchaeota archaeon]|nr:type II toxin-antitoxin system VapC family toxin [Candidatus Woesearchaeota archaeon]
MLDSDIIIAMLRNDQAALAAFSRHKEKGSLVVSSFTWYEIMIGCGPLSKKGQLAQIVDCLEGTGIMYVDDTVATVAARFNILLSKKGRQIGMADKFIAASCVVNGQTLITRNTKHFEGIPGLKVEAW